MRALVWVGVITIVASLLVAALAASGALNHLFPGSQPDVIEEKIYDTIAFDGWYVNKSDVQDAQSDPVTGQPIQPGLKVPESNLKAGGSYYFLLSANVTDFGLTWFKKHIYHDSINAVYRIDETNVSLNFVVEISNADGIDTSDVNISAQGSTFPDPNVEYLQQKIMQVDAHTVRAVLSRQPFSPFHYSYWPVVSDPSNITKDELQAWGPTGIIFSAPGNYSMSFYLADTSNGEINRNLTSTTAFSPSVQYSVEVNPPSISFSWGFYSDAYPKWMAYINQVNDQVCFHTIWIYGGSTGWYNGTVVVKASVDNGSQFVTLDEDGLAANGLGDNITITTDTFFSFNIGMFPQAGEYMVTLIAYDIDTGQQITGPYTQIFRAVLLRDASTTTISQLNDSEYNAEFNRTFLVSSYSPWGGYKAPLMYPNYIINVSDGNNYTSFDTSTIQHESRTYAERYNVTGHFPLSWYTLQYDPWGYSHFLIIDFGGPGTYTITITPVHNGELAGNVVQYTVTTP